MSGSKDVLTIYPGEWYFGGCYNQLVTILGSCVAVTAWHPAYRYAGMCHFLLPGVQDKAVNKALNPRYGVDALEILRTQLEDVAPLESYRFGCFGGAEIFTGNQRVGFANHKLAYQWLENLNIVHVHFDIGGREGRKIILDVRSGIVGVRYLGEVKGVGEHYDY